MVSENGIAYHERKHGELFCDSSAQKIIDVLLAGCRKTGAQLFLSHKISAVAKKDGRYRVETDRGAFTAPSLVVATGGLSIPKVGATGFGFALAEQFGLRVVELAPALDGFVFADGDRQKLNGFAGIALDAVMTCNGVAFRENLLFTHAGFSGPPALQASLHWYPGDAVHVNFLPGFTRAELLDWFAERKSNKAEIKTQLAELVPKHLADRFCEPRCAGLGANITSGRRWTRRRSMRWATPISAPNRGIIRFWEWNISSPATCCRASKASIKPLII